jgi:hypothetical protein
MTCLVYQQEYWPDFSHCPDCHRTWHGLDECHCASCHSHFGSDSAWCIRWQVECRNPATMLESQGSLTAAPPAGRLQP